MKIKSAIKILKHYNKWRQGAEIKQPNPRLITEAINTLVSYVENLKI